MSNPFDYVNSINSGKSMFGTDNDELIEQKYTPYMVNRALSQFVDTVHSANEMNVNNHLDKKLQYDFLINIVRPRKRFKKWAKAIERSHFGNKRKNKKRWSDMTVTIDNMVEVQLPSDDDFLKVRETLTRIGVASRKDKTLFQSCHILHKQGRYFIVHFKELFSLDGKPTNFGENDIARRNTIANLLAEWGLIKILSDNSKEPVAPLSQIKILPFKEKNEWTLTAKYNIGKKR